MKGTEVKKIVVDMIKPYLISNGFELIEAYKPSPSFIHKSAGYVSEVGFHFISYGNVGFSKMQVSVDAIEDIILDIGIPNNSLEVYKVKETEFLTTLRDTQTVVPKQSGLYVEIETERDALAFADWILVYLKNTGLPFTEHYSHLPNVLAEMTRSLIYFQSKAGWRGSPEPMSIMLVVSDDC
jgi:hypothetical protein